ncbi:MAG: hypothetical protein ACE5E4_02075 [Candidatus Binatia bacterium]
MGLVAVMMRLLAVALVAAALMPRGFLGHYRVIVLLFPGVELQTLGRTSAGAASSNLSRALAAATRGPLRAGVRINHERWSELFSGVSSLERARRACAGSDEDEWLWRWAAARGAGALAVNVPSATEVTEPGLRVVPAGSTADGFVGGSAGIVVTLRDLVGSSLPHQYQPAVARAGRAAGTLASGHWSAWIETRGEPDGRSNGVFRIYRLDSERYYFTPVYRVFGGGGLDESAYVSVDPSWAHSPPPTSDFFLKHLIEISQKRLELALSGDWEDARLVVYVDPLVANVRFAYSGGEDEELEQRVIKGAYSVLDRRVGEILGSYGREETCLILLVDEQEEGRVGHDGYFVISCVPSGEGSRELRAIDLFPTVAYLLGLPAPENLEGEVPSWLRLSRWRYGASSHARRVPPVSRGVRPLDAAAMEQAGALLSLQTTLR